MPAAGAELTLVNRRVAAIRAPCRPTGQQPAKRFNQPHGAM